jgi:molecular chaperone GrpE
MNKKEPAREPTIQTPEQPALQPERNDTLHESQEKPLEKSQEELLKESQQQSTEKQFAQSDKVRELTDLLQRSRAEFDNYRKRMETTLDMQKTLANSAIVKELIPVLDNLGLSLRHTDNPAECLAGVHMIKDQLQQVLETHGVQIETQLVGKPYDPKVSMALAVKDDPKNHDKIIEVITPAYYLSGQVIKHAQVIVGKKQQ